MNPYPTPPEPEKTPRWETATMVLSFVLVWAYFLAFQSARREGVTPHFAWNLALLGAVIALIVVFVRRLKRTLQSLRDQNPRQR
ncbi:MAG TPA: hypothetical protein VGB45_05130 [Abditibacterium sp.]|jgi:lipid-A-disaccharide synthase-like uncharacterized protein